MTIEWNKVTWYSKLIAIIFFVITFAIAFYFGTEFQKIKDNKVILNDYNPSKSRDFSLKVNESGKLGDFKLTLVSVLQDSRCPSDVQCIQAGNVRVSVQLERAGIKESRELAFDSPAYDFHGYSILIKEVKPNKHSRAGEIAEKDYAITFHVERMN